MAFQLQSVLKQISNIMRTTKVTRFTKIKYIPAWLFSFQKRHGVGAFLFVILLLCAQILVSCMFGAFSKQTIQLVIVTFLLTVLVSVFPRISTWYHGSTMYTIILAGFVLCHCILLGFLKSLGRPPYIVFVAMLALLICDVGFIVCRENLSSLCWLIFKIVLLLVLLTLAHMQPVRPWAGIGVYLNKVSTLIREPNKEITNKFLGLALSAGAILVFKDGLDALGAVPYSKWNAFSNKTLCRRKSFAIIITSGYLLFLTFNMWSSNQYEFFEGVCVVLAIIVAECVAKLPIPSEKSIGKSIAASILSRCGYPCLWAQEKALIRETIERRTQRGERFTKQVKSFHMLWSCFASVADVRHQAQVISNMGELIVCNIPRNCNDKELKLLMFSAGILCCPTKNNTDSQLAHIQVLENSMQQYPNLRAEFFAGMRFCSMALWKDLKKDSQFWNEMIEKSHYAPTMIECFMLLSQNNGSNRQRNRRSTNTISRVEKELLTDIINSFRLHKEADE